MSNFKLKKSEFMELNLNKKVVNEAEEKELTSTELEEIKPEDEESKDEENKESDNEETKEETPENNGGFDEVIAELLHSRTQTHIFHWQTVDSGSYSAHMALQGYYEALVPLIDAFVESYQGKHGIIKGYKCPEGFQDFDGVEKVISYLASIEEKIEDKRSSVKESYLQNQIDMFVELLNSTIYKLKFLK
jgi:DNA-binding ferritin-like protein